MTATMQMKSKEKRTGFTMLDCAVLVFVTAMTLSLLLSWLTPGLRAEASLTEAFQTKSFRGSAEALTKANWIGTMLHYIISWFSFLGLCLTLYQKFITLLYLSARQLFDTIYEVKVNKMKGSGFGYGELIKGLFQNDRPDGGSSGGGGLDVFITFFYSLLPNVKAYSDFSPDRKHSTAIGWNKEKDEEIGVSQYMLKTAIPTIMLVFFLTIGYSGTLAQAYGTVVDGMAAAADHLVSQNLETMVKAKLGTMGGHTFQLGNLNTEAGDIANKVANDIYVKILGNSNNVSDEVKQGLGQVIEDSVFGKPDSTFYVSAIFAPGGVDVSGGILGGQNTANGSDTAGNAQLTSLLNATIGAASTLDIKGDEAYRNVKNPNVYLSSSPTSNVGAIVWKVADFLNKVATDSEAVEIKTGNEYIHVNLQYDTAKVSNFAIIDRGEWVTPEREASADTTNADTNNSPDMASP